MVKMSQLAYDDSKDGGDRGFSQVHLLGATTSVRPNCDSVMRGTVVCPTFSLMRYENMPNYRSKLVRE